jgi:uncharacterized membrane protein HdeD (DUF308 family)
MVLSTTATVELSRWWWTFVVRGLLAIAFGVLAFLSPRWGITILVALFAAWALIDGVGSLIAGWRSRSTDRHWWVEILEGVVSVAAGVIAVLLPTDLVAGVFVILIAAWAIVTGAFEIYLAIRLREKIEGEIWMGLAGFASILFGVILFLFPGAGALSLVWIIGSFAIAFGVFLLLLGWRLRGINELARRDAAIDHDR